MIIPNSLKNTVVFSLQLLRNMLSNSVCSECYCCQTFTQQEQNLITIRPYTCSPGNRQYCKVPTSTSITVNSTCPYKNDKVAQACDMVVTSLYTRNMLSTTLFPGYDNLVKPCHNLVSLYKVVNKLSQDLTQV